MSSANILLKKNMSFLLIAVISLALISGISQITNANALNNYFNCVTKKVNQDSAFQMQDAFVCYDSVFKGAQKYSKESYQNPDLTNLDNIKPVAVTPVAATTTTTPIVNEDNVIKPVPKIASVGEKDTGDKSSSASDSASDSKIASVGKPQSTTSNNNPLGTNKNTHPIPGLSSDNPFDISPLYESFNLPFTAVIPQ
jgi:hypothetical protein